MMRLVRSAWVIGRRDFAATVLSKAFIFFLLGPLFPLLLGGVFGGIGAQIATRTQQPVIAVVSSDRDFARLSAARDRLTDAITGSAIVSLVHYAPANDPQNQTAQLLKSRSPPVRAVLTGSLESPHLTGAIEQDPATLEQLRLVLAEARSPRPITSVEVGVTDVRASSGSLANDRAETALYSQMLLFFL